MGVVGSGAVGEVYKVEHKITRRVEAMKVLLHARPDAADQGQRFLREIQLQASLSHPNIAGVLNALRVGDDLVMVMELVEGETLDKVQEHGGLSMEAGIELVLQALSALSYAHAHGVTHRDIKPSNILITADGAVKLTDFGLARTPGDPRLTQTGAVVGSLHYISPEQVQSAPDIDYRTDIYSMGAVLYEVVTGSKPFAFDNAFALMLAHVQQTPVPPAERNPKVPGPISRVVMRALAKKREERFQSIDDFRQALEIARMSLTGPMPAGPRKPASRVTLAKTALVLAAAGILGFGVMMTVSLWQKAHRKPEVIALSRPDSPAAPAEGFEKGSATAQAITEATPLVRKPEAKKMPPPVVAPLVSREPAPLPPAAAPLEVKPAPPPAVQQSPPILPRGFLRPVGQMVNGHTPSVLAVSPDGRWLAVGTREGVVDVWELRPARRSASFSGHTGSIASLAFTPDGQRLVSGAADGAVKLWNLRDRMEASTFGQGSPVLSVAVSPDGRWVAFGTSDKKVRLWSLVEKGVNIELKGVRREPRSLAFHPMSASLAMAAPDKTVRVWEMRSDYPQSRFNGLDHGAWNVSYSQDGQYLAVASLDQVRILQARDGAEVHTASLPSALATMSFLAGGHCIGLLQAADGLKVWDLWQDQELKSIPRDRSIVNAAFRPDGRELAMVGDNSIIALWQELPLPLRPRGLPRLR
ncbi:MAG: protein kinase domain-containing protein [Bryobacteraceae bacterium]